jgi:hypothetical protein
MVSLVDLEKKLVKSENLELQELDTLVTGVSRYCVLSGEGFARIQPIENLTFSDKDRIHLVLSARYLGSKVQELLSKDQSINAVVSNDELANYLRMKLKIVNARVSDLRKEGSVKDVGKARYVVMQHSIEPLVKKLDKISKK